MARERRPPPTKARPDRPPRSYPAETARQGEIILRRTWQQVIFFGGLVLLILFAFLFGR